jgi:hypothetical protein
VRTEPTDPDVTAPHKLDDTGKVSDVDVASNALAVYTATWDDPFVKDKMWPVEFDGNIVSLPIDTVTLPDSLAGNEIFPSLASSEVDLGRDSLIDRSSHFLTARYGDVLTMAAPGAFRITVAPGGDAALKLFRGIPDQEFTTTRVISVQVPVDAFVHTQAEAVVMLSARSADGGPLPPWLSFDASTGKFSGNAPVGAPSELEVVVEARDRDGRQADAIFRIHIGTGRVTGRSGLSDQLRAAAKQAKPFELARQIVPQAARGDGRAAGGR